LLTVDLCIAWHIRRPARHRAAALLILAALLPGCSASRTQVAPPIPTTLPSAAQLFESLAQRRSHLRGLRTVARLRYRSTDGVESARHVLAIQRPDQIRIEVLALMGTIFAMTASGGQLSAYVPSESTFYRGDANAANLARYLPIEISVSTVVDHALSTPPLYAGELSSVERDRNRIQLLQAAADGQQIVWFRSDLTPVSYRHLDHHGAIMIEATYEDIKRHAGIAVAEKITLRFPATEQSLEISMKSPEVNPDFPPAYFSLPQPRGSNRVDL